MVMPPRETSARRDSATSHHRSRARSSDEDRRSSSPVPSPGSWNIDRGRSRVRKPSNPFSEESLRRKGYHSLLSSFGKVFHVEKRWKLIRELGSGAYGVVVSAADEISGETVAIKMVTRVFEKIQLAKRALREITLLRHFANHENITGLIDVDAISPNFNEIYIFMEPMEADLHQIIKSGQSLTNEHVQYFVYQILRGMKFVHSASVIHRDLKPGNLLVNADCELKICDFGLSRGFDARPDENATHMTEYVATRWYRAPEIMLAFRGYSSAIDVWSIGCILAELLLGRPLFKGKDYVDQLNKVLDVLGSPDESVVKRIGSEKAQAYVRSLPLKRAVPLRRLIPAADTQAHDLLNKMLSFDPSTRISVPDALEHPWLASYHDITDEPECPTTFEGWRRYEGLETLDEFRKALWDEIEDFRREVRGINLDLSALPKRAVSVGVSPSHQQAEDGKLADPSTMMASQTTADMETNFGGERQEEIIDDPLESNTTLVSSYQDHFRPAMAPADPVVTYARRSSILQPSRQGSTYNSPVMYSHQHLPSYVEDTLVTEPGPSQIGGVSFPTQGYVVPARSRTASIAGGEPVRKLLRTLSTVSIHESGEGLAGGLADIAPIGKFIMNAQRTADAPASEMPRDFGIEEEEEGAEHDDAEKEKKDGRFRIA